MLFLCFLATCGSVSGDHIVLAQQYCEQRCAQQRHHTASIRASLTLVQFFTNPYVRCVRC
jgi:hypothetical protein